MKPLTHSRIFKLFLVLLPIAIGVGWWLDQVPPAKLKQRGAGLAMDAWAFARAYPADRILMRNYSQSFDALQADLAQSPRNADMKPWEAIGPMNIAGRTLALAINPLNPNSIYAGTASGGLWRTRSQGRGVVGWEHIPTGFPLLGVASVAMSPADTNVLYIGTGEVYAYQNTAPGIFNRLTRGTYGIGILKSSDGGETWTKSLDWAYGDLRGVADLLINPLNPQTVFAATSEGLYRSRDAGESWALVHNVLMANDIEMHASDTNRIYVSHGNFNTPGNGLYRSSDGGSTFTKMTQGLPANFTGKALISISASSPNTLYASVADSLSGIGLFRTDNGGTLWQQTSSLNVPTYQGWYSHDVIIHPEHPDTILWTGIDVWKSTNGGFTLDRKTFWYQWYFGRTPVGGPEGGASYVHADIHQGYIHPNDPNTFMLATDGGFFISEDIGESWAGRNGSFHCTQFYANFSNSTTDSLLAIGGMQDNSTAVYLGDGSWRRVIGGDGLSAAIHPQDDNLIYGSAQYLNMRISVDRGMTFDSSAAPPNFNEETSFAGPYELAPTTPNRIYAARERVYRSDDGGDTYPAFSAPLDLGNPVLSLAVSPLNANEVLAATAPLSSPPAKLFRSLDAALSWQQVGTGLPDRVMTDIAFDPVDANRVYLTVAGFGTAHLYISDDKGLSWTASSGLPDVPANTVIVDPLAPAHVYVGNDLGVYVSEDAGASWEPFMSGLSDAVLAMHLSISPANRKLRVATHGHGVYETALLPPPALSIQAKLPAGIRFGLPYPNPTSEQAQVALELDQPTRLQMDLLDMQGRVVRAVLPMQTYQGTAQTKVSVDGLAAGRYLYRLQVMSEGHLYQQTQPLLVR